MKEILKNLLKRIINDIDAGNTDISEDEAIKIVKTLSEFRKDNPISKYEACRYLNISRATFDNYVRDGKLPKGTHKAGFKELFYSKKDLDDFINKMRRK